MADEYAGDIVDYQKLMDSHAAQRIIESKQKELELDLKRLIDEEKRLHNEREFVYSKG
tara:strand:+ start:1704 stop:1877 length:174 start_codon:yes stop_codon:yes gene_type:complete